MSRGFGSDNHSAIHPRFLNAIEAAQGGHQPSYGLDEQSLSAKKEFQRVFPNVTDVEYVFNGTAANVLALNTLVDSYHSVICSDSSHLNVDECGAPEFIIGCKLQLVENEQGKISPKKIEEKLIRKGDQHFSQPRIVSITQPTELGTVYSLQELREIKEVCNKHDLLLHIDGARFFLACASLGVTPAQVIEASGADALSLSGTKNGFLLGEAVLFFKKSYRERFKFLRKQRMQLPSKTRFFAAQFESYLRDDFFVELAEQEIQAARRLHEEFLRAEGPVVTQPVETNAVFAQLPSSWIAPLKKKHFFYVWDQHTKECRFMTTFDTTEEQIKEFGKELRTLSQSLQDSK